MKGLIVHCRKKSKQSRDNLVGVWRDILFSNLVIKLVVC